MIIDDYTEGEMEGLWVMVPVQVHRPEMLNEHELERYTLTDYPTNYATRVEVFDFYRRPA